MEAILQKYNGEYDEINGIWIFPSTALAKNACKELNETIKDKSFTVAGDIIMEVPLNAEVAP